ncbi:MAG: ABC transporter substrate-binding protein [Bacillota bacterium]|nr:ABC transporter substrate-binding protein [Bacillota bacterium]
MRQVLRLLALALCLSLLATITTAQAAVASRAPVEIALWHDWTGEGGDGVVAVVDAFNKSQSNIVVKATVTPDLGTKLLASVAGRVPPDVVLFDRYMTGQYASRDALTPLDTYIARDKMDPGAFFEACWNETVYRGKVYSIPFETNSRVLMYNKRLFKEAGLDPSKPPETWDDLVRYSHALTKRDEKGRLVQVGFVPIWNGVSLVHYLWQCGGDAFNADATRVTFNGPEGVEALEWVVSLVNYYGYDNLVSLAAGFGSHLSDPFYTGKVAMKSEGCWMLSDMRRYAPNLVANDLGVAPLPRGKVRATIAGGFSLVIPKGAAHSDAAWEFIKFAVSKDAQILFARKAGTIPALKAAALDPQVAGDPLLKPFIDAMEHARYRPVHPAFPEVESYIYQAVDKAVHGEMSPEAALEWAAGRAQKVLDRYNRHLRR